MKSYSAFFVWSVCHYGRSGKLNIRLLILSEASEVGSEGVLFIYGSLILLWSYILCIIHELMANLAVSIENQRKLLAVC